MRDLLLLAFTAICSIFGVRQPVFGLLAYIGYGVLSPQSFMWGSARTFPHSKVLVLATLLGYCLTKEKKAIPRQREIIILFSLWGLFSVSTIFAFSRDEALIDYILVSKIFTMSIITACLINSEYRLHLLLKVIGVGLGLLGAKIGVFVLMTGGNSTVFGPEGTYLEANNTIGMALAMNVPLLLYLSKSESSTWVRWAMKGMLLMSYPAVAGTFSRGAWLGLAVITFLMVLKSKQKVLAFTAAGIIAIIGIALIPKIISPSMANRYDTLVNYEEDGSAESRFWNWEFCKRIGLAHPITGAGFKFYSPSLYPIYYPEFVERWGPGKVWSCHNMYLAIFAEHGLLSLFLWLGLLGSAFVSLRRIRKVGTLHDKWLWMVDYADMLRIAMVGFIVMGMFVDVPYYEVYYQLLVAIIVTKQLAFAEPVSVRLPAVYSRVVGRF